jgi:hypothetical protein
MTKKSDEKKAAEQAKAIEYLHEYLKPGSKVYTILRHVSKSGMNRCISVVIPTISKDGKSVGIYDITHLVAQACDLTMDSHHGGVKMGGCGMDMGFALVYGLASVMWHSGFDCIGDGCPSNDHSNHEENAHHVDGGYALRKSWL